MALFNKKKTADAPAASPVAPGASADTSGDISTVVDDFSDFSADAVQTPSTPAPDSAANGKRAKAPRADKKTAAPRAPKGALKNGVYIGLNIGTDSVKVLEAQAKNGVLSITGMGMVPTPADSISNGVVMSVNALAGAIKEALAQAGIKSKRVVTSVSGTGALVVRIIEVPKMSDGELEDNMKMDADRYIPFPPSEVIMDFKALRDLPSDPDAANMEVLLAAAQREIIDLHIQVLQDAKLDPRAIDVEPLAAARALTHPLTTGEDLSAETDYSDVAAILNIGASGTEISILRGDLLVFTRTVPAGGNSLTQAITDTLGLAWHDAESLKREMGDALAPNESTPASAAPVASNANEDWSEFETDADTDADAELAPDPDQTQDFAVSDIANAQAATDPFDEGFFDQGPQNAEPGEQHQQKEAPDENDTEDDAKNLPARAGEPAATEAISGALGADPVESTVLPTRETSASAENAASESAAPAPSTPASTPETAAAAPAMPVELRELFNFEDVDDPDEELPTVDEGKPVNFNSLLGEEEDDFSDLPTLVSDAPAATPMASAFDFPSAAPTTGVAPSTPIVSEGDEVLPGRSGGAASTEAISSASSIDADEASLLPSEAPGGSSAVTPTPSSFAFQNDPFAASVPSEAAPTAPGSEVRGAGDFNFDLVPPTPEIPEPMAPTASTPATIEDPFAAFDLSGAAPATMPEAVAPAAAAASTPTADDFDLDSLFNSAPATSDGAPGGAPAAPAPTLPPDAGMNAMDILNDDTLGGTLGTAAGADDFGTDFASFGAGLGGASTGEIDAQTLYAIVGPALDTLVAEVRRSLEYHTTRYPDAAVRRVTLVGGGAKLKNIDAYFTQSLGIPTTIGNPLARLPLHAPKLPPGYADENGPLFAVALGLAMRELMR